VKNKPPTEENQKKEKKVWDEHSTNKHSKHKDKQGELGYYEIIKLMTSMGTVSS